MSKMGVSRLVSSAFLALGLSHRSRKENVPPMGAHTIENHFGKSKIVKEGWLFKRSTFLKTWSRRYFVLLDDGSFLSFKARPEPESYSDALNNFSVKGGQVMCQERPRQFSFIVRGLRRTNRIERMFSARSNRERARWVRAIELVDQKLRKEVEVPKVTPPSKQIVFRESSCGEGKSKLTLDDFELMKVLGRGSYGKVILSREKKSDHLYAMKIVKKKSSSTAREAAITESRVLRSMNHPFIVDLKYAFQTADRLCFLMEYVNGGELRFHLSREGTFSVQKTRFYAAEIILALEYLHDRGIIHRDLKLENLLLDKDGHVKLTDFGTSKDGMTFGKTTKTYCGSPAYLAPEILKGSAYGRAVDWWCLGVAMYQMMFGRLPFRSCNLKMLFGSIMDGEVKFPSPLDLDVKTLLMGLLTKDPEKRLGGGRRDAKDIKKHVFFSGISWKKLLAKEMAPPFTPRTACDADTRYFKSTTESVQLTPMNYRRYGASTSRSEENRELYLPQFSYRGR